MVSSTRSVVDRLGDWASYDISDALSKLGQPDGGFLEGLRLYSPKFKAGETKIVGSVFTVKFAPKSDLAAPKVAGNYMDQIPRDAIIVVSQPLPHTNACFGGLMSMRAQYLGAKGVVIDGSVRDLKEHRDLGFPVFARNHSTNAGNSVCFASELNVPVTLHSTEQNVTIHPDDYIIADLDGVVCLPARLAEDVLQMVPGIADANDKCAKAIQNGIKVEEAFGLFRGKGARTENTQ